MTAPEAFSEPVQVQLEPAPRRLGSRTWGGMVRLVAPNFAAARAEQVRRATAILVAMGRPPSAKAAERLVADLAPLIPGLRYCAGGKTWPELAPDQTPWPRIWTSPPTSAKCGRPRTPEASRLWALRAVANEALNGKWRSRPSDAQLCVTLERRHRKDPRASQLAPNRVSGTRAKFRDRIVAVRADIQRRLAAEAAAVADWELDRLAELLFAEAQLIGRPEAEHVAILFEKPAG